MALRPVALCAGVQADASGRARGRRMREASLARAAAFTWARTAELTIDTYRAAIRDG